MKKGHLLSARPAFASDHAHNHPFRAAYSLFQLEADPPLAEPYALPILDFCPILRATNFGWVSRSDHIFYNVYCPTYFWAGSFSFLTTHSA